MFIRPRRNLRWTLACVTTTERRRMTHITGRATSTTPPGRSLLQARQDTRNIWRPRGRRISLRAWDLPTAHLTRIRLVLRAGYGRFFVMQEIRTGDPLQINYNLPFFYEPVFESDGLTPSAVTLATGFPALDPSQAGNAGVTSQDWNPKTAVYDEWNLNLEYQLPGQILISPAYVGSKGTHLQVLVDKNQIATPQATFDQSLRPYPQYGPFTSIENRGNSTYHAFQLKVEKKTSNGLYLLSAYTLSKSINDQPEICCNAPWPQDSYNLQAEKGLSDFDNRHRWVTSFDYALPIGKGQKFLKDGHVSDLVLGGWHLGGIVTIRSGFPFSPQIGFDPTNTGSQGLMRPDRIGSGKISNPGPNMWFNINDFPAPTCNCFGNAGQEHSYGAGREIGRPLDPQVLRTYRDDETRVSHGVLQRLQSRRICAAGSVCNRWSGCSRA